MTKSFTLALVTCLATIALPKVAEAASFTVLADGLDNAKGIGFGLDGSLYVTEAGRGGNGACVPSPSANGNALCYGTSGAISKVENGSFQRILTGLPSVALADGTQAAGPHDIKFDASGKPYVLMGYAANPSLRDSTFGGVDLGKIIAPDFSSNSWTSIADLANYELVNNPDGGDVVSNPLDFIRDRNSNNFIVVDAGANDLLSVSSDGNNLRHLAVIPRQIVSNLVFPPLDAVPFDSNQVPPPDAFENAPPSQFPVQPVPSGVAQGPDGAYYVAEFTGFPFPQGGANIYRVAADGQTTVYASGFTQLTDLDFDTEGNLYALQYANKPAWQGNFDGSLIQIAPNGTRTTLLSGNGLESPTALTLGADGAIYVTNRGGRPGQGQVIRVENSQPVPEPTSALSVLICAALGVAQWRQDKTQFFPKCIY